VTGLEALPSTAVAYALGLCMGRKQKPETAGRIAALIAELKSRGVYGEMLSALDPELVAALSMMETMDAGQAWNRGRRARPG
jgi:hypothetical protein